ncbi:MAG: sigma-70 region 4 domain-containing protein, partial [Planctomycetes bacterium]|nr:sigma-70 region 4 domain-containing protein [Planctomycetota bacterium]
MIWDLADRVLGQTQREALWLRYAEAMPIRDVAKVLGRSPVTLRVMLFRAR